MNTTETSTKQTTNTRDFFCRKEVHAEKSRKRAIFCVHIPDHLDVKRLFIAGFIQNN